MNLEDYKEELKKHDWFYDFTEDHHVWKQGSDNHKKLIDVSKESEEHLKLFNEFKNKYKI
jgi:hypothetical protein